MLLHNNPKTKTYENIIFKRISSDCAINLGLPTGALNENEDVYEASTITPTKKADFANIRQYNVQNFKKKDWKMGRFFIKFDKKRRSQPLVGDIQKEVEMIQIDFFPVESLYEAILRDKRLKIGNESLIRKWYFKFDDSEVPLSNNAALYNDTIFSLYQKQKPDVNLPDNVPDLLEPKLAGTETSLKENDALIPKTESNSNALLVTTSTNSGSQVSSSGLNSPSIQFTCNKDLEDFLKKHFDIEVQKQAEPKIEKKRISNIKKLFTKNYEHFALTRGNLRLVSEMKDLIKMFDSVGAVVAQIDGGEEFFKGTCFVIGSQYVITNKHVIESTLKHVGFKDFYVDFEYKDSCNGYKFRFSDQPVVSSPVKSPVSSALDYAILKLREPESKPLPPSLTKCGYVIPSIDQYINSGDWLTLVGYPQHADGKAMEDACPLKPLPNLDENMVLALSQLKPDDQKVLIDGNRQTYETGAFFHGSSGSPGVLINEKLLVVLHCRGFPLHDGGHSIIEQGVRMSAIRDDVANQIKDGITLNELFDIPLNPKEEPMEIDSQ